MSRVGKVPVKILDKVDVKISGHHVVVKGAKGQLERDFSPSIKIEVKGKEIHLVPENNERQTMALWGTTRNLLNNMVVGVSEGFRKDLEFNGVGYKAVVKGSTITLNLGYSHPIDYQIPKGVTANVNKNIIELSGCDKELVGFVAAKIKSFRPPEPYKGKGLRYTTETIRRKAGKSGAGGKK